MMQESWPPPALLFSRRSARSMLPFLSQATTTTCIPAICAGSRVMPCAELGIRQISHLAFVAASVIMVANRQQASIFNSARRSSAACRRRHSRSVSPASRKAGRSSADTLPPALDRAERVQPSEFRPGSIISAGGRSVSWCRSPARINAQVQRQIYAPGVHVAHHLGFIW